jgi:hypothetical protein
MWHGKGLQRKNKPVTERNYEHFFVSLRWERLTLNQENLTRISEIRSLYKY